MNILDADGNAVALDRTEQEVQAKAIGVNTELSQRRQILTADMLAGLIAPRARFECDFPKYGAYFFTIDGMLNGRKIQGAMFAAECILVFAANFMRAQELANSGLRSTVELLHKEYETRSLRGDDLSPVQKGIYKDVAGRRGREGDALRKMPKMRHFMEHIIGGLPWRW